MPKDIKYFKILFVASMLYQLAAMLLVKYLRIPYKETAAVVFISIGAILYLTFLFYLYYTARILKINNVITIQPGILILLQFFLSGKILFTAMIIPIFLWVKTKRLAAFDEIKTYDAKSFMLPPR